MDKITNADDDMDVYYTDDRQLDTETQLDIKDDSEDFWWFETYE